jgi:hypothetical protein
VDRLGVGTMFPLDIDGVMTLDLSEDEKLALAALLKRTIEDDHYPLSLRLRPLKAILAKLEPRDLLLTLSRAEAI